MSVAAKIYNRMLLNRIYDPVNSLLRPEQSGFRRGRSCIEQIHTLRRLMEGFHKKQLTLVSTFIDFRKAFDFIDKGKIHEILRHYGIPPKIASAIMILYDNIKSSVMIDGRMSTQFYVTKGVLQGDTLAPFLFVIVLDYILRQTELGSYGVPTHQDKILHDLDFADDIVFFDKDAEAAADHVTHLQETASSVGLNINFQKTKAIFINSDLVPIHIRNQQIELVDDFHYLGSMIASSVEDLKRRRGLAWTVFWRLESVWRSPTLSLPTKLRLFDSLAISVMFYASEAWPVNAEMARLINSFATNAYRVMTGVRRLDRVHNSTVLTSVNRRELIYTLQSRQLRFLGHLLRSERAVYALYKPQHGSTRRGRPRTNFIGYIQKLTGRQLTELTD